MARGATLGQKLEGQCSIMHMCDARQGCHMCGTQHQEEAHYWEEALPSFSDRGSSSRAQEELSFDAALCSAQ